MHYKKTLLLALLLGSQAVYSADNASDISDKITHLDGTIQSINGELNSQRSAISNLRSDIDRSNDKFKRQILEELKALQRQNQFVYDSLVAEKEKEGGKVVKPLRNYDLQTPDGKMILGGEEFVYVKEANATIAARIDTGASQSSISAQDITEFERNGKKWMRFTINHNDRSIQVEAPFVAQTKLRQSSIEGYSYRPIVRLNVKIGDYSTAADFNLVDRSRMQFALLIGRTLLTDIAVVDVSRNRVQPRADKDGLTIISIDDYVANQAKGINVNEKYDALEKARQGGQIATVSKDATQSLGTNAESSLPSVREKIESENGTKLKMKTDKKAKASEETIEIKEKQNSKNSKDAKANKNKASSKVAKNDNSENKKG